MLRTVVPILAASICWDQLRFLRSWRSRWPIVNFCEILMLFVFPVLVCGCREPISSFKSTTTERMKNDRELIVVCEFYFITFQYILAAEQLRNCSRSRSRMANRACEGRYDQRTF